jgi:ribonuclease BN (tRNA processing enzyme)
MIGRKLSYISSNAVNKLLIFYGKVNRNEKWLVFSSVVFKILFSRRIEGRVYMKIKVLGCSGAEFPKHHFSSFLIDGKILFDAGSITDVLSEKDQLKIKSIFVTHAHLDHIKGIPFLADNILIGNKQGRVDIFSILPVIKAIKENLLNDVVWPDFTKIPRGLGSILRLNKLKPGEPVRMDGYCIIPFRVNHAVPAVGYLVESQKKRRLFYSGDTGPTDKTWKEIAVKIDCLILDVTFPNKMAKEAIRTGHLTPLLLRMELSKMKNMPERIYVTHAKPQYSETITSELRRLRINHLRLLKDGESIEL